MHQLVMKMYQIEQKFPQLEQKFPQLTQKFPQIEMRISWLKNQIWGERILRFCVEAKNIQEIMEHLGYRDKKTVRKYLTPLLQQGRISMTIPDKPNSKNQKYITIK